jgi:A/G-specific adenine glycosylase
MYKDLIELPGVGPYTAGAVMAFAYNKAVPMIETNIRTVIIHHFFHDEIDISDTQLFPLMGIVLDTKNPREWYYALMDYGAHLKKTIGNQNQRSKHYTKQSTFKGSDRQIRGAILRALSTHAESRLSLHKKLPFDISRIDAQLERLLEEGMLVKNLQKYSLP